MSSTKFLDSENASSNLLLPNCTETGVVSTTLFNGKPPFDWPANRIIVTTLALIGHEQIIVTSGISDRFKCEIYKLLQLKYDPAHTATTYDFHETKTELVKKYLGGNYSNERIVSTEYESIGDLVFIYHYAFIRKDINLFGMRYFYRKFDDMHNFAKIPGNSKERIMVPPSVAIAVRKRPIFLRLN